jgi:hypothetical protein
MASAERGDSKAILRLKPDGKFEASNVPASMVGIEHGTVRRADGNWQTKSSWGQTKVHLTFQSVRGLTGVSVPYGLPLEVSGVLNPRSLYYYLGDPDENRIVEFKKIPMTQ